MAITVAEYQATLSLNGADFDKGMKNAESSFGRFKDTLGTMGSTIATGLSTCLAAGVTAMTALTTKALSLSGELEQNMGGSEAVFKEYATSMQETAKEAYASMGLSTSDFLATANKMGALFQGAGFDIAESADISTTAMQRAADVASIMGIDTAAAMEAIAGAAKGNFTMMDNLGVAMNDTTLNAYAMEKGIGKTTQQMTNQEKIGLAMQMFLEKTSYAAGNYAKENETLAGALGTAKAALTNFLDGSGDVDSLVAAFSNAASVIIIKLNELLPQLVTGITGLINQVVPMLPGLLQSLLPGIIQGAVSLVNGLVQALPTIITALMAALPTIIAGVQELINGLLAVLPEILQTLIDTAVAIMPVIAQALIDSLPTLLEAILAIVEGLAQSILDAIPIIIASLPELINQIVTFLLNAIPQIIETGISLFVSLVEALPTIIETIIAAIPEIINNIITTVLNAIPQIIQSGIQLLISLVQALPTIITTIVDAIPQIISSIVNAIVGNVDKIIVAGVELFIALIENLPTIIIEIVKAVPQIINSLVDAFSGSMSSIVSVGTNLVKGIFNGISNAVSWLYGKLKSWVSSVLSYIKSLFGIHSPSKETAYFGEMVAEGLGVGIEDNADAAIDAANDLGKDVLNSFDELSDGIADAEANLLKNGVKIAAEKKVTLSTNYDNGIIGSNLSVSGDKLIEGLSNVFNDYLVKSEQLIDKLRNSISVGSLKGIGATRNLVVNMGDISLSGVLDKTAAEQIRNIVDTQVDQFADALAKVVPAF